MPKFTNRKALDRALFYIIEQNMTVQDAAKSSGANLRTVYRKYQQYLDQTNKIKDGLMPHVDNDKIAIIHTPEQELNIALHERAQFMKDMFRAKKLILERIIRVAKDTRNIDALQKTLKTLSELENIGNPKDSDMPGVNVDTANIFQFFNQKLIDDGYQGKPVTDADIIEGD